MSGWRRGLALALFPAIAGCAGGCEEKRDRDDGSLLECQASMPAFVRNAHLAILGSRPLGAAEVSDYLLLASGGDAAAARTAVVEALFERDEFVDRWTDHLMDALRVQRIDDQEMSPCYAQELRADDDGALARHVRDTFATDEGDGLGEFTMRDLLESAIRGDDLSTAYRAHLFPMVAYTTAAANVDTVEAELARREDYGAVFDAAYLNRDLVCLGCHNSESSVTFSENDAENRHWPLPGHFEKSLFGASTGVEPERAHAVFRYDGFVRNFGERPWGWAPECGDYDPVPNDLDPAGIDAKFGAITGQRVTVYDLEASLKRGVDALASNGLRISPAGEIDDPDQAFAYLVGATVAEGVWEEVIGSPLTIANYFPRNEASRDVLRSITDTFVRSHFSLKALLAEIVASPYFSRSAPENGCGAAYDLPNVYDPWVVGEDDPELRHNGTADGVADLSGRTLVRSVYRALEWNLPTHWTFPNGSETEFQRGIGLYLKNGEPGFRGLDFQARLTWEDRFGACQKPSGAADFVDRLTDPAALQGGATVKDVVIALKDRILNDARLDELPVADGGSGEAEAVEALVGSSLEDPASGVSGLESRVRKLCGAYLSTPQFLLGGLAHDRVDPVPAVP